MPPIDESNISRAWCRALLYILERPGTEVSPLIISTTGLSIEGVTEDLSVKLALDEVLANLHLISSEQVAFTIFPQRLWSIVGNDRQEFYALYNKAFRHYKDFNRQANGRGLYFERLIDFDRESPNSNQLEWIISQHASRPGVRDSMYQASVFDPRRDHSASAQLQFPCLQHVSFVPTREGLSINAFYATQQLLNKAYGNYLGLARLAVFMAAQMQLPVHRLNVFIGVAKLDKLNKTDKRMLTLKAAALKCIGNAVSSADKEIMEGNETL